MHNYATGQLTLVDGDNLTDDVARQLIPQDRATQATYDRERQRHVDITLAMSRALLARSETRQHERRR
jgi:hypothetical protein